MARRRRRTTMLKIRKKTYKTIWSHITLSNEELSIFNRHATFENRRARDLCEFLVSKTAKAKRPSKLIFPGDFSLIENPDDTVKCLLNAIAMTNHSLRKEVKLDRRGMNLIGYGAEVIFGEIAKAAMMSKFLSYDVLLPENRGVWELSKATGLPKMLGIRLDSNIETYTFRTLSGRERVTKPHSSTLKDLATHEFVNYLDECYKKHGLSLKFDAKTYIGQLLAEVLGNAEGHTERKQWWIGGYYQPLENDIGVCHLVIFNFGKTIFENFDEMDDETYVKGKMIALADKHQKFGFNVEELFTYYACQPGVSTLNVGQTSKEGDRGQGLADVVETVNVIGSTADPKLTTQLALISGRSYILFDQTYRIGKNEEGQSIIPLNNDSSLLSPPDSSKLKRLSHRFPGTVVTAKFYLDRSFYDPQLQSNEA